MTCPGCGCVFCPDIDLMPGMRAPRYCSRTCKIRSRRKRNGRKAQNGMNASPKRRQRIRSTLWKQQDGLCALCNEPMTEADASIDHIVPQAHGGSGVMTNLRLAHTWCNVKRADACPGCPACEVETASAA